MTYRTFYLFVRSTFFGAKQMTLNVERECAQNAKVDFYTISCCNTVFLLPLQSRVAQYYVFVRHWDCAMPFAASCGQDLWLPGIYPSYYVDAKGVHVKDVDGNEYCDFGMHGIGRAAVKYNTILACLNANFLFAKLRLPLKLEREICCFTHPVATVGFKSHARVKAFLPSVSDVLEERWLHLATSSSLSQSFWASLHLAATLAQGKYAAFPCTVHARQLIASMPSISLMRCRVRALQRLAVLCWFLCLGKLPSHCYVRYMQSSTLRRNLYLSQRLPRSADNNVEGLTQDSWSAVQDDWGSDEQDQQPEGSDEDREKELEEYFASLASEDGADASLESPADFGYLEDFSSDFAGDASDEVADWSKVALNDTWTMDVAQVPGSFSRFLSMSEEDDVADIEAARFGGDSLWPAGIVMARWMAMHPPPFDFRGKIAIELGSGLSLPGILAVRLGAEKVLLVDRMREPLLHCLRTAAEYNATAQISTVAMDWQELPSRLEDEQDELREFANADVVLGSDVFPVKEWVEPVASVLDSILTSKQQVAFFINPVPGSNAQLFKKACEGRGLTSEVKEIVTWEEEDEDFAADWVCQLVTVRRS
eukprot:2739315-Amphidinium_carterae.1